MLIPNGPARMTIDYISQFTGQGSVYIRPIQCSLDQTVVCTKPSLPEEMCNSCLEFIPMDKLREHANVRNFKNVFWDSCSIRTLKSMSSQTSTLMSRRTKAIYKYVCAFIYIL